MTAAQRGEGRVWEIELAATGVKLADDILLLPSAKQCREEASGVEEREGGKRGKEGRKRLVGAERAGRWCRAAGHAPRAVGTVG